MVNRGSEWNKWDLHIHSKASDGDGSPEQIIAAAKEKNIDVIALTDHHTAKYIDETKKQGEQEKIKVISGIEFRSEYGEKSVHFIGLFPDSHNGIVLNSKALHELILSPLGLSETIINIKGRGQNSGTLDDDQAFREGMFLVQVDFKNAANLIHQYGGLVVVHAGSKANSLDLEVKHQGNGPRNTKELYDSLGTLKEELFKDGYIDICEIRKENDSQEFYLSKFNKPSITASDAHTCAEIGSKYVWIKADTTFNGLRQIIYEPEARVRICDSQPERKNDYQVIDNLKIHHNDIYNDNIYLNQNLNTIIGGRSSGKSILLGAVAKKIGTEKDVKFGRPEYNSYIISELVPNIDVEWRDGITGIQRKIDYFPQTYINNLAADSNEIVDLIESIIKNDTEKKLLLEQYLNDKIELSAEINNAIVSYFQLQSKRHALEKEKIAIGVKEGIVKQLGIFKNEIDVINSQRGEARSIDETQFKLLKSELESRKNSYSHFDDEIKKLKQSQNILRFDDIEDNLMDIDTDARGELIKFYAELINEFSDRWRKKISEVLHTIEVEKAHISDRINQIENDSLFLEVQKFYSECQAFTDIEAKRKIEQSKLDAIIDREKAIDQFEEKIESKKKEIFKLHNDYYNKCSQISEKLGFAQDDVKITCVCKFNNQEYSKMLSNRFNQRSFEIQDIVSYKYENNEKYLQQSQKIFEKILDGSIPLKGNATKQQAIIDIFSNSYYELTYDVLYENDSLMEMSEGKKAFIIMRMLLDFNENTYPIFIDQPEDDLDNRAIYDDMVKYIRKKKLSRQIILVTHNPNIVVGADSELVICANQHGIGSKNQKGAKFEYCTGSIEFSSPRVKSHSTILNSQGIKEHICDILEGGDEAFKKRELRYKIPR